MLRRALLAMADSRRLRDTASHNPAARRVARRFVAGERLEDALKAAAALNQRGARVTLDHLGEAVHDPSVARRAAEVYLDALAQIGARGLDASVSVKPTQLGLDIDAGLCQQLIGEVAAAGRDVGTHVTIDMEGSAYTQATVDLVLALRAAGHDNVGCAVQAYLHRTPADVRTLTGVGASLRLCKGAYAEPEEIAWQHRDQISNAFLDCAAIVLSGDTYGRFATHDHVLIGRIRQLAHRLGVGPDRYEFQMLHGIREPLRQRLLDAGHDVRIYVPFGGEWYPYLTRRLAERPANLLFFLRALAGRRA